MSSHLSTRDIDRYRSRAVTADEVRAVDSHVSECEDCRRSLLDSNSVNAAYNLVRDSLTSVRKSAEMHVAYEKMAAFVDDGLNATDRALVEDHMRACPECEMEITELVRLREAIASEEESVVAVSRASVPFWRRIPFRIAAEAFAVLLIIVPVVWFSNRQIESLRTENEQLRKFLTESQAAIADLEGRIDSLKAGGSAATEPQISLRDGDGLVTVDSNGYLRGLESFPEEYRQSAKKVLETGQVSLPPVIAQLRTGPDTTMSGNADEPRFKLSSPVGIVVETSRPMFRWTQLSDAIDYQVSISNTAGEVIQRATVTGANWRPPASLARGGIYQWQVRATTKTGSEVKSPAVGQPDAQFSVLDHRKFKELQQARKAYSGSHLMMGTVYAKAGLIEEAKREFQALLKDNPESQITRRILAGLNRK